MTEPVEPVDPPQRLYLRDTPRFPRLDSSPGRRGLSLTMRDTPRFPRLEPPE